jgi:hypothetical protein
MKNINQCQWGRGYENEKEKQWEIVKEKRKN